VNLVPTPDQVVSAAANLVQRLARGSVADLRPMPRMLLDGGELRRLHHYRPGPGGEAGDPVLLVPPLAAPALCYDLRRGCSLVEHLLELGRPTYLVEYGEVSFHDRAVGLEPWGDEVVPSAVVEVSRHAGGRPVHVVGWSLGGIFALLAAAVRPDLPVASLTVLGAPVDVERVPLVAPPRPLLSLPGPRLPAPLTDLLGDAPAAVAWATGLAPFQRLVTKPLALATHLDDAEFLAQVEAVDRFRAEMAAYPGRSYGQLYHRFVRPHQLSMGRFDVGGRVIDLAAVTAPVLVVAGATDGIAPVAAVKPLVPELTGAREARFEIVPGGHLGLLTGRAARGSTWPVLDAWFEEWSGAPAAGPATTTATKATVRKATAKKSGTNKAGKTAAKKTAATKTAGTPKKPATRKASTTKATADSGPEAIGVNPRRRYGSHASRGLAR